MLDQNYRIHDDLQGSPGRRFKHSMVLFKKDKDLVTGAGEENFIFLFGGILTLTETKKKSNDPGTGFQVSKVLLLAAQPLHIL